MDFNSATPDWSTPAGKVAAARDRRAQLARFMVSLPDSRESNGRIQDYVSHPLHDLSSSYDENALESHSVHFVSSVCETGSPNVLARATVNPLSGNVNPLAANVNPLGGNVNLLAANINPLAANIDPLGGNIDPLGHFVAIFAPNNHARGFHDPIKPKSRR